MLAEKFTSQVSKNIELLSLRGYQDLLTWNIKKYSNWKSQNPALKKAFFIFSLKWKQLCYKLNRLSALIYKRDLQECITVTCPLILLLHPVLLIETISLFTVLCKYFYLCERWAPVSALGIHGFHSSDHTSCVQLQENLSAKDQNYFCSNTMSIISVTTVFDR